MKRAAVLLCLCSVAPLAGAGVGVEPLRPFVEQSKTSGDVSMVPLDISATIEHTAGNHYLVFKVSNHGARAFKFDELALASFDAYTMPLLAMTPNGKIIYPARGGIDLEFRTGPPHVDFLLAPGDTLERNSILPETLTRAVQNAQRPHKTDIVVLWSIDLNARGNLAGAHRVYSGIAIIPGASRNH